MSYCHELCCDPEYFKCLESANPSDEVELAECEWRFCDVECLEKCELKP